MPSAIPGIKPRSWMCRLDYFGAGVGGELTMHEGLVADPEALDLGAETGHNLRVRTGGNGLSSLDFDPGPADAAHRTHLLV